MFNTTIVKIINVLMNIMDNQIDANVAFWVGQYKLVFELEHRYGGDLRLEVNIYDELAENDRGCWNNVDYIGIWDDKSWTPKLSRLTAFVENAVVRAEGTR